MPTVETIMANEKEPDKAPVVNGTETLPRPSGKQVIVYLFINFFKKQEVSFYAFLIES